MDLKVHKGWLSVNFKKGQDAIKHCVSPNFNQRPEFSNINLIVIHSISLPPGEYGNDFIDELFCNRLDANAHPYFKEIEGLEVSAHVLIKRDGSITQYVSFLDRAWHAGASCFEGVENCNDFSIGIELEGLEGEKFEQAQYQNLAKLCCLLMQEYPDIHADRLCRHSDIAPGRKQDPGPGFDWQYFMNCLSDQ